MWTDENVATLKKLWLEGLSASQVAKQIGGVTRNAVIGKVHRLGLSGRGATVSLPRRVRPERPPHQAARRGGGPRPRPPAPTAGRPAPPPEGPGLISCLTQLRLHVCKWPIGDPLAPGFTFCGVKVEGDGPYCDGHHGIAHQPKALKPLAQDPYVRRVLTGRAA